MAHGPWPRYPTTGSRGAGRGDPGRAVYRGLTVKIDVMKSWLKWMMTGWHWFQAFKDWDYQCAYWESVWERELQFQIYYSKLNRLRSFHE